MFSHQIFIRQKLSVIPSSTFWFRLPQSLTGIVTSVNSVKNVVVLIFSIDILTSVQGQEKLIAHSESTCSTAKSVQFSSRRGLSSARFLRRFWLHFNESMSIQNIDLFKEEILLPSRRAWTNERSKSSNVDVTLTPSPSKILISMKECGKLNKRVDPVSIQSKVLVITTFPSTWISCQRT